MGSLFTEGNHLYLDRESPYWKKALKVLMGELYKEQELHNASNILLRDMDADDQEMNEFMVEQDFVKVDLPESCVVENLNGGTEEDYLNALSKKNRRHFVQKIKRNAHFYDVQIKDRLSDDELQYAIGLFKNVKDNNFAINTFLFSDKLFYQMNQDKDWEFVVLYLKEEFSDNKMPVSVCFCHKNANKIYSPMLIGMDYTYLMEYGVYRQTLYQVIKRANALRCEKINFGISAAIEKQRVGAKVHPRVGYYQAKDNYAMAMMEATFAIDKN
jgi:hypothetical protein